MVKCTAELIGLDKDWIPERPLHSMYIRPNSIAMDNTLGLSQINRMKHLSSYRQLVHITQEDSFQSDFIVIHRSLEHGHKDSVIRKSEETMLHRSKVRGRVTKSMAATKFSGSCTTMSLRLEQ